MSGPLPTEREVLEQCANEPMVQQVLDWAAVNSGSGNLAGLADMTGLLADAFSILPGQLALRDPAPTHIVDQDGRIVASEHGRNLHLIVRPDAPVQLLLTGHMD